MDIGSKNVFVKSYCDACIHKEVCSKRQTYEKTINEIRSQVFREVEIDIRCKHFRDNMLDVIKRTVVEENETMKLKQVPMPTYGPSMSVDDAPAFVADESKDGSCSSRKRMEHF